jgi:regulatory GntR family protein
VAELMDKYAEVADWDLSTRKAIEAYIRRVIKPASGHLKVRKIRGRCSTCSMRSCDGAVILSAPASSSLSTGTCRPSAWPLGAVGLPGSRWPTRSETRVSSGMLSAGDSLPSVQEMSALLDVRVATLQHALAALAEEGLIVVRQGRTAVVAGDVVVDRRVARPARGRDHDCRRAGCQSYVCRPLTAKTIRNIHSMLSGSFSTAERWDSICLRTTLRGDRQSDRQRRSPHHAAEAAGPRTHRDRAVPEHVIAFQTPVMFSTIALFRCPWQSTRRLSPTGHRVFSSRIFT